jgi:6-phosphogluconolactonase
MTPERALPTVLVLATPDEAAATAAAEIATRLAAAIESRGVAHWATTGGSAAPGIYRHLRVPPLRDLVDWARVHVWWGDDRFVPADDPLSNVLPFDELLVAAAPGSGDGRAGRADGGVTGSGGAAVGSGGTAGSVGTAGPGSGGDLGGVRFPAGNVHPIPVADAIASGEGPAGAAGAYETALLLEGPGRNADGVPVFDVIVLGVGPDGHVLSVFPDSAAWDQGPLVVAVPAPAHVEPHVERVTMHPDMLAAARSVLVVSTGASKAAILGRAWGGDDVRALPVRATMIRNGTWILDVAAAAELPRE